MNQRYQDQTMEQMRTLIRVRSQASLSRLCSHVLEPEERGMAEKVYVAIERAVEMPGVRRIKA